MQNAQYPDFKSSFKYENIGNIVGTLNFAKELKRKDESVYGWEFLINAKGYGSINVRIPMMDRAQESLDNFPVEDKPRVRAGLSRLEQFTSDAGKTYTNATTFISLSPAQTVNGEDMRDNIAGRFGGEVYNIMSIKGDNGATALKFSMVSYPTKKDDKTQRATQHDGTPVDPQVVTFEVHDPALVHQFQQTVRNGSNIEVGYRYLNKSNVTYDEFGYATQGDVIERVEVGKLMVQDSGQQQQNQGFGGGGQQQGFGNQGFGQQQQQQGFGQQQGGFGQQQQQQQQGGFGQQQQPNNQQPPQQNQQQGFGDPNQYNMPDNQVPFQQEYQQPQGNPFGDAQQLSPNDPAYQQAQQAFGQGGQQGGFGFGN